MAQDNRLSIFCTLLITHYDYIKGVIKEISSQSGEVLRGSFSMCEIPRIPGRWMGYGVCWGRKQRDGDSSPEEAQGGCSVTRMCMCVVVVVVGSEGWTKPVRTTGAWAQRWQVGMWGLEVRMKTRRLVKCLFGAEATPPCFPTFGYKMSGLPEKFAPTDKNVWRASKEIKKLCESRLLVWEAASFGETLLFLKFGGP